MDKSKIIAAVRAQLEKDLLTLKEAAAIAHEAATNEESKPENQYDTRALEASYIADAQAKRVGEIEELLSLYKFLILRKFTDEEAIASTALVELELNRKVFWVFVMSKGGGMNIQLDGQKIQIVTPSSPLGEALLGLRVGDTAAIETGGSIKEYDILSIE